MINEFEGSSAGRVILSICIPTRNRASFLKNTIESIVGQPGFASCCELIVSDNASDDETPSVVGHLVERFPNILYRRNEKNVGPDENFFIAFNEARGEYIHLLGDKVRYEEDTLGFVLPLLERGEYTALCLLNANKRWPRSLRRECGSLDEFVDIVSFRSTWMSGIILRKKDFDLLPDKRRSSGTYLIQTDWLLSVVAGSGKSIVINKKILNEQPVRKLGPYPLFEVFITNYRRINLRFVECGKMSRRTLEREMSRLLLGFVFQWYIMMVVFRQQHRQASGATSLVLRTYWRSPVLYLFPAYFLWWLIDVGCRRLRILAGKALRAIRLIPRLK